MSDGSQITIETPDGPAEAYLTGEPGRPGVLMYIDIIGLRPRIEEMADRIASWGCTVLAPNAFFRSGTAAELAPKGDLREEGGREEFFAGGVMQRLEPLPPEVVAADAELWVQTLLRHAADAPIGVVGFCAGARFAVRVAGQLPDRVAAVGGFHAGGLVTDEPDSPHLAIAGSQAQYAFGHADNDGSMPPEAVETLGETLTATGRPFRNEIYPEAPHGYSMADTSSFHPEAAERAFRTLQQLFADTLGTTPPSD